MKNARKLKWQIPGEPLAARYNWCQGPVPGRGPAVEKHYSKWPFPSRLSSPAAVPSHRHALLKCPTRTCMTFPYNTLSRVFVQHNNLWLMQIKKRVWDNSVRLVVRLRPWRLAFVSWHVVRVRGVFRPRQTRQLPRAVDLKGRLLSCQSY